MLFTSQATSGGVVERDFLVDDVPGVLWTPTSAPPGTPLVLMGHPGGLHKRAAGLVGRARAAVLGDGFAVAAIDAPGHGDRPRSARDHFTVPTERIDTRFFARYLVRPGG